MNKETIRRNLDSKARQLWQERARMIREKATCDFDTSDNYPDCLLDVCVDELARVTVMQPMETAPRDGTHILIKTMTRTWDDVRGRPMDSGTKWVECFWGKSLDNTPLWRVWTGNVNIHTSETVNPVGWAPVPN